MLPYGSEKGDILMKKLLTLLLTLTLIFALSCKKDTPKPANIETAREYINNEEIEKAHTLLLTLEGDERDELLSHFSYLPEKAIETDSNGTVTTTYVYDKRGNVTEETVISRFGEKQITKNEYDKHGKLLSSAICTDDGDVKSLSSYTYDESGNLLTQEEYREGELVYKQEITYNENGDKLSVSSPASMWIYEYNEKGMLSSLLTLYQNAGTSDRNDYTYDEDDRLTKHIFTDQDGSIIVKEFVYFDGGKIVTETENGKISGVMVYNQKGNMLYEAYPLNKTGLIRAEYEYTDNEKMKRRSLITLNGKNEERSETVWEFSDGLLLKETSTVGNDIYTELYIYNESGTLERVVGDKNDQCQFERTYNEAGDIIRNETLDYDYTYEYDANGNLLSVNDALSEYSEEYTDYKLYYNPNN